MHARLASRVLPILALACCLLALASPGAIAQNDQSRINLQRENDQLRERVQQLEARIGQLERENASLKTEVERLRNAASPKAPGAPATPGAPGNVPTTTDIVPLESQDALASVDALALALQSDYAKVFADRSFDQSDSERTKYIQDVRKWTRDVERQFKGNVEWTIRLDKEHLPSSPEQPIPFWVIDAQSGRLLHNKPVKHGFASRIASRLLEDTDDVVWNIRGQLAAKPTTNAERFERGMLDYPLFIGPFAEFGYELDVRSVQRPEKN